MAVFYYLLGFFSSMETVLHLHIFTMLYVVFIMFSGTCGLLWNPFISILFALTKFGWVLLFLSWSSLYIHFGSRLLCGHISGEFLLLFAVLSVFNCALLAWTLPKYRVIANGMEGIIFSRRHQRMMDLLNQPVAAA